MVDRATYEQPKQYSEGIEYVLVNGRVALEDDEPTGAMAGKILRRSVHEPTRPMSVDRRVSTSASGKLGRANVSLAVSQDGGPRDARGHFELSDGRLKLKSVEIGQVQATDTWASFTGIARDKRGQEMPFLVFVEEADPFDRHRRSTVTVRIGDDDEVTGSLRNVRVKG